MQRLELIKQRLEVSLMPSYLEVIDESHQHIGHPGAQSGGGHYLVVISSPQFVNKNLLSCHRLIYDALADLMHKEIHALKIKIK